MRSREVAKILVAPRRAAAGPPAPAAEVWRIGEEQVNISRLLARLAQRGFRRVVVEGGGEVNYSFLEAGLVDEIRVTLCPFLLGGASAPTLAGGTGFASSEALPLRLVRMERRRGEIFLCYRCLRRT
jgi:riboflavin biosynthesis pyrimidine reductase